MNVIPSSTSGLSSLVPLAHGKSVNVLLPQNRSVFAILKNAKWRLNLILSRYRRARLHLWTIGSSVPGSSTWTAQKRPSLGWSGDDRTQLSTQGGAGLHLLLGWRRMMTSSSSRITSSKRTLKCFVDQKTFIGTLMGQVGSGGYLRDTLESRRHPVARSTVVKRWQHFNSHA